MKTYKYIFFPILLVFSSCYLYKPYSEKTPEQITKQTEANPTTAKSIRNVNNADKDSKKVGIQQGNQDLSVDEKDAQMRKENEREGNINQNDYPEQSGKNSNLSFSKSDGTLSPGTPQTSNKEETKNAVETPSKELGIKDKLQPNKYYKISALGNQYKIQVDKWEGDSLVSHKIRQPKKVYKHHMNDIEEEAILERRFSKPFSDLLTVGAYASGAAILLLLVL